MSLGGKAFVAATSSTAGALCGAILIAGWWWLLPAPVAVAATWHAARHRHPGLASACFAAAVGLCAAGMLLGLSAPLMLAGSLAALCSWDLDLLCQKSDRAADREAALRAERAHLRRLLAICGASALLGAPCLFLRISLGFAPLFLLGVLLAIGLSGFLRMLRKAGLG